MIFQDPFRRVSKDLRKCNFPDEGELELFDFYSKSNCELECAWAKAEQICGCKPWHVPAGQGSNTCFVLGNVCFQQIMEKIKNEKITVDCGCSEDCVYSRYTLHTMYTMYTMFSRYTMSLSDKQILERTSTGVFFQFPGFAVLGTNEMLGNDFTKTSWYNMGN